MTKKNISKIEELIKELLFQIGEDPGRDGIVKTPERVAKAWEFFCRGYSQDLSSIINNLYKLPGASYRSVFYCGNKFPFYN